LLLVFPASSATGFYARKLRLVSADVTVMNISAALRWECLVRNVRLTAMLAVLAVLPQPARCQQGTGAKSGENAASDNKAAQEAKDAAGLDLEQLASMNVKVTSVSKTEQSMSQVAAAIFVITQEDIRRSGATNIPDLLRMVPGMDVAQINANNWAISARGFNSQFANKLLVLIDGRAVYTPLLGGVNWDTQDVPLEDIERIEVIRGPGATLWGSNAVNGVINVITKKASETQGGLIAAGGGTQQQAMALAQYGGKIGKDASYRVFTKYLDDGHLPNLNGENARDGWHLLHGGFRVDDTLSKKDALTVQGDLYTGREGASIIHIFSVDPPDTDVLFTSSRLAGGNVLGRWSHEQSNRSNTTLQLYFDNYTRSGPEAFESRDTFDIDFDHHLTLSRRHDLIWGAGYRRSSDHTVGTIDQAFIPADRTLQQFGFFAQDEITLKPDRVFLTAGAKLERSTLGSFEFQPNVRIAWTPSKRHTFWASLSRASRTPARRDTDLDVGLAAFPDPAGSSTPVEAVLFGAPKIKSEHVVAWEAGYRAQPGGRVSLDLAAFFNVYDHLFSVEPQAPFTDPGPPIHIVFPLTFANKLHGETAGAEASANWKVTRRWTLSPGYALLTMHLHADPSSLDTSSAPDIEGSSPRHQAQLRSHLELGHGIAWDAAAYFTDRLPVQQVSGYTRVDTQLTWQIREKLTLSVAGQNLVQDHHVESLDELTLVNASLIKRSAYGRITWRFR